MDYDKLYTIIPKEPKKWQVQDVQNWLLFIELPALMNIFEEQHSIDGSILELIDEQELEEELLITQKIIKKKILNWLKIGLKEYADYIKRKNDSQNSQTLLKRNINETLAKNKIQQLQLIEQQQQQEKAFQIESQLILQPLEDTQNNCYCITEQGAKIGRHSSNSIFIMDENISRYHAEIVFQDRFFSIKDIGSTTGTYIKINKIVVEIGMLIELGSNLFLVQNIEILSTNAAQVILSVIEGPNQDGQYQFKLQMIPVTLGRKNTSDLSFPDDNHMSNTHGKFYLFQNQIYFEDLKSTNGSWLRLSSEGQTSNLFLLLPNEQYVVRIGMTNQYRCIQNIVQYNEQKQDNVCIICQGKEKDALLMPCKHNIACFKCAKLMLTCKICSVKIQDCIKIYKN